MAKNMARIKNGLVMNIEWCSDKQAQTESLISLADRPVAIGDTYDGTDFYRDGEMVLTPMEKAQAEIEDMKAALNELGVKVDG